MVYISPSQKGVRNIEIYASACIVASVCMARARQTEDQKTGSWDRETAWAKRAEVLCQGLKCGGVLGGDLNWSDFTCWPESTDKTWDFPFSKHISVACSSEALLDLHRLVNSCKCPIFWIPNIPFQFFEILLPDFSRKSMFQRARSSFTSRSGSPSVQPRHRGDWGKRRPRLNVFFFISICSLSDHYHHISSLSLHIRRFCFRFAKPLPLSLLVESFGQDYPIIPKWPSKTVQHCAAMQNCEVLVRGNECPAEGEGPQFGMEQKPWITRWWNLCRPH